MAQVYSVNAVGFVTIDIPVGLSMIANPLTADTNTVAALFPNATDGTTIYKYNFSGATPGFTINSFGFGAWDNPTDTLLPGEGAFIKTTTTPPGNFTVTFVGQVSQGGTGGGLPLSHPVPKGLSIQSSEVPQSGPVVAALGFPATDGDTIYQFDNASGKYVLHDFSFGTWGQGEPVPKVGESFFVQKIDSKPWTRVFSVNTTP
jgi:hypothetical protein